MAHLTQAFMQDGPLWYWILSFFLCYSVLGWCTEVAYAALKEGRIINRGFLFGPVCPIYGFGMLLILSFLTPVQNSFPALFLGSMFLTTTLELVGGFLLYKLFHMRWWDYTDETFNLGGYICPKFTLFWGIGATLVMNFLHPLVTGLIWTVPGKLGCVLIALGLALFAIDLAMTLYSLAGFSRQLKQMERITGLLHRVSDSMSNTIGSRTLETIDQVEEHLDEMEARDRKELAAAQAELEQIQKAILEQRGIRKKRMQFVYGSRRLLKAFPNMKSELHQAEVDLMKNIVHDPHFITKQLEESKANH